MSDLARGVRDISRGFGFLNRHPKLWGWVIAPAAVTLVILAGVITSIVIVADALVRAVTAWLPSAIADAGAWLVWSVVLVALVIGGLLVFVSIAGIVAGPFNELLSEAVEQRLTGKPAPPFSVLAFARGIVRGAWHSVRRLLVTLLAVVLLFVLGFVPVIGTIAALLLGGYFAARAAAYDCYDAVLSRRELPYREKLEYLKLRRGRSLGLGAGVAGLLLVPGLNLIALGLGAAGATLAAHEADAGAP